MTIPATFAGIGAILNADRGEGGRERPCNCALDDELVPPVASFSAVIAVSSASVPRLVKTIFSDRPVLFPQAFRRGRTGSGSRTAPMCAGASGSGR